MRKVFALVMVVALAFAGVASGAVQQGDTELDAMLNFVSENGAGDSGDFDSWSLSAGLGYFVTDNVQVGVTGLYSNLEDDSGLLDDREIDMWALGIEGKYHFMPTNQMVPYVGAQILFGNVEFTRSDGDVDEGDALLWGPLVGMRYELNANNDFFVEYQYHIWDDDIDAVLDDGHAIYLGIIHQFK